MHPTICLTNKLEAGQLCLRRTKHHDFCKEIRELRLCADSGRKIYSAKRNLWSEVTEMKSVILCQRTQEEYTPLDIMIDRLGALSEVP